MSRGASLAPLAMLTTWDDECSRSRLSVTGRGVPRSPLASCPTSPQCSVQGLCVSLSDCSSSPDMAGDPSVFDEPGWETQDKAWSWAP